MELYPLWVLFKDGLFILIIIVIVICALHPLLRGLLVKGVRALRQAKHTVRQDIDLAKEVMDEPVPPEKLKD